MKIFLDESVLNDSTLSLVSKEILDAYLAGNEFYLSVVTHFQLMWGYSISGRPTEKYETFLKKTGIEIAPVTKLDAEAAARMKPKKTDLLDALIASSAKRYDASVWTSDKDFLKFLPREMVRIF